MSQFHEDYLPPVIKKTTPDISRFFKPKFRLTFRFFGWQIQPMDDYSRRWLLVRGFAMPPGSVAALQAVIFHTNQVYKAEGK